MRLADRPAVTAPGGGGAARVAPGVSGGFVRWVCRAGGVGVTTFGGSRSIAAAKITALHRCERRSPLHVCTIIYCR